jgi:LCP family protein required for cell wall assembly
MKRFFKGLMIFLIVVILLGGGIAFALYYQMNKTANKMHESLDRDKSQFRSENVNLEKNAPISILVAGVDERAGDKGRSDVMIVLTVNPKTHSTQMLSIPRDSRVNIPGRGYDKINAAYAYGGMDLSVKTVENSLQIPIDYYVKVNMQGFSKIVDLLGGITVNNPREFTFYDKDVSHKTYHFAQGEITLNGEEALAFSRMRKQDPLGDAGRNIRQRLMLEAIVKKGKDIQNVTKIKDFLDALGDNVKTNLTFDELRMLQSNYSSAADSFSTLSIEGKNDNSMNGIWYYLWDETKLPTLIGQLKSHLEIK